MLARRLRSQRGFTLIELLVAASVGSVVLLATFALVDRSVVQTGQTQDRVDSASRGRVAMDQITRELRSQACPSAGTTAILDAQDYSVTFYAFTGANPTQYKPEKRVLMWDTNTNSIIESRYVPTGTAPNFTYPATPTSSRTLLADVSPEKITGQTSPVPIFQYYAYTTTGQVLPTAQLATPVAAGSLGSIVKIRVNFVSRPTRRGAQSLTAPAPRESTTYTSDVFAPTADPNNATGPQGPVCG